MSAEQIIAPIDLRDFLKSAGWVLIEEALRVRIYAFRSDVFLRRQLLFPMDITAPDYADSVFNVFEKLSNLTGQDVTALRKRAQFVKDDVVRLRVYSDRREDHVLPLSFAASLVQNTAKLLKAAACTVLRPRMHHPRLALNEAVHLVDTVRFGQTEEGSFVLNVACPVHAMEVHGLPLDDSDVPFVRQVTASLQRALCQLTGAIEADRLGEFVDGLKRSAAPLLSSNLCEAVSCMHDEVIGNSIELAFDWSALCPVDDASMRLPIRIQRDYFARIEEVRRELRSVERHEEGTFIGTVERLDGDINVDGRRSGEVVLSLLLPDEEGAVRAKLVLSPEDYEKADRAHMANDAYVRVSGRLRPGRQPRQLTHISSFEVIAKLAERP